MSELTSRMTINQGSEKYHRCSI